jgi:pyruvate/2-oxoglutarate dehydrogenase complex dihydrolipoamide dehydrogenase (E3) component
VYLGHGEFVGSTAIEVNGKRLEFTKACVATGGKPKIP